MPRAPRKHEVNTTPCSECQFVVKYKNDIARHMKRHAKNKEELMIRCPYPGCEYKNLQKSNVANHTRRHGYSKASPCPFPNCTYFTLNSRFLKEHMLAIHGYVRVPRRKRIKVAREPETSCSTACDLEYGTDKNGESSSLASDIGLTFSNEMWSALADYSGGTDQQQPLLLNTEGMPPQLMSGEFPFYQAQPLYPPAPDGGIGPAYCPSKYAPTIALNGIPMPSIISSGTYYVPGPVPIPVQQQVPVPMANTPFQNSSPLPSPASSFSCSSFPDNGTDFLAEFQALLTPLSIHDLKLGAFPDSGYPNFLPPTGLSAALESPAYYTDYPSFMTGLTPACSAPWFSDAGFAPSTDFNYGGYGLLPVSAPAQEYNCDFHQFL